MTPTYRHFDTRPDEFSVAIDGDGTLLNAEWRKNITENEDGSFDAKCCFVPQFVPASVETVRDALVGIFFKCTDSDKGDMMQFYMRSTEFAQSLSPEA